MPNRLSALREAYKKFWSEAKAKHIILFKSTLVIIRTTSFNVQ
jgi:hypothetical protein